MEVPFYFNIKEFEEKYFEDYIKYKKHINIPLVKFLELVLNRLNKECSKGGIIELYIENSENIEIDYECLEEYYTFCYENMSKEDKQKASVLLGKGGKKDIKRFILKKELGVIDNIIKEFKNETLDIIKSSKGAIIGFQYIYLCKAISNTIDKEKYYENLYSKKSIEILEQDFSNNEDKEKVILLEKLGIIDFIKEKQIDPNTIKHTAEILSSFTGIKSNTLYTYLRPMLSAYRDDTDKNSPYKNPENLQKANKTFHKLQIKINR